MSSAGIFVQIAAYRDPELLPTLRDCLRQARAPERLSFGICWQHDPGDSLAEFEGDSRFRVVAIPHQRSRGACWARSVVQKLYQGEPYTLQIDSHHRFIEHWDDVLIAMLEGLCASGHPKPILTSYAPVYDPADDPAGRHKEPLRLCFDGFLPDGPFAIKPHTMDDHERMDAPEPARFFSAHFAFMPGSFCNEVPYDPRIYFFGEEHSLAVRAFTHGYDLFHPHRVVLWHHYGRNQQPKHWDDNRRWTFRDQRSMQRFRQLILREHAQGMHVPELDPFGLGTIRTLTDYEHYAGICFSLKGATDHALQTLPPPEPELPVSDEAFRATIARDRSVNVDLSLITLPLPLEKYEFCFCGAHDRHGRELIRVDLRDAQLAEAIRCGTYQLTFQSTSSPCSWTFWPYRRDTGWAEKTTVEFS